MELLLTLATALQIALCLIVTIAIAVALSLSHFPVMFRFPLCLLGTGSIIYAGALSVKCWPVVRLGQGIESFGVAGLIVGLLILTIRHPKFFNHGR